MKKNIFRCFGMAAVVATTFTSCLENVGNRFSLVNIMSTVVSSNASQVIVQIDATGAYYYADELLGKEMREGDRILLEKMTVNNDEQPVGATGAITNPIKMIEVAPTKINTKDWISTSQDDEALANDSVELFYAPYINKTKLMYDNSRYYITFSGVALKKASPDFRLVFKGRLDNLLDASKDTLCYELKAVNAGVGSKGEYEAYAQCFNMPEMKSEQIVKIYYSGKKYQGMEANKINASYCIITAPTIK